MEANQHSEGNEVKESAGTPIGVNVSQPREPRVMPVMLAPETPASAARSNKTLWVSLVVIALLVAAGVCIVSRHRTTTSPSPSTSFNENTNVNTNEYQALFLSNGQVYFGKLSDLGHKYVTIHDIYYLQVQQNLQAGGGGNTSDGSKISLAKLGTELHGPEDKMYVASGQVLFWENLKDNSQVVQAIQKYHNQ